MKKNIFLVIFLCFVLTGCFRTGDGDNIIISQDKPLSLLPVEWTVVKNNEKQVNYCVTQQNFSNLSLNMEEVQNRLYLYHQQLYSEK